MLPYLHILIRVEDDGSLHALGAFTSKEKQVAYQKDAELNDSQVRLDFFNGPFDENIKVIYAGHRRWNMDLFQLGGYFRNEGEAWTWVTQEGYVSVLRIDTTFEAEKQLEHEALKHYAKLQRRWRLATYQELIEREGVDKTHANIKLRFYEDALESFKPKNRRDLRALYTLIALLLCLPLAIFFYLNDGPDYGENLDTVNWLPDYTHNISYYRSKQIQVYEFTIEHEDFRQWATARGMRIKRLTQQEIISRYKAYLPAPASQPKPSEFAVDQINKQQFESWQNDISAKVEQGLIAEGDEKNIAVYNIKTRRAYYEQLINF
jgi:hypothetical protein